VHFFEDESRNIEQDDFSLVINYRCNSLICELSNKLFLDFTPASSGNNKVTSHDGVFLINRSDIDKYLSAFSPIQLRDNVRSKVNNNYPVLNFGESKGLSFDRVLIYPTKPFIEWLADNNSELAPTSRSKFYVALTRARYSVGIVCEDTDKSIIEIQRWKCKKE